jgi:DNA-binding transcriptional MerR regulator
MMVSLSEALRIVSGAGVSLPELLREVQQQTIHATRISHTCTLNELFLDSEDVCRYATEQRDVASQGFCSMQQVLERLRCKPRTLQRLNDAGLLIPHQKGNAQRWLYRQEDIEAFLAHYIDSDAAAVILGCTRITVQQWVRSGRLTAITGPEIDGSHVYRFEKVALIQWRHERVTFGEAVQIIGKSRATLHRWVEQGNLQPLDGIGGKHRWFWRADVEQLADTHSRGQ